MSIDLNQFKLTPEEQKTKLREINLENFKLDKTTNVQPEKSSNSFLDFVKSGIGTNIEATKGALKGAGETAVGLGQLTLKGAKLLTPKQYEAPLESGIQAGEELKQGILKPKNTAQAFGKTAEQIGEFMIPVGKVAKVEQGATLLSKSLNLLKQSAVSGSEFAGKTAIQTGGNLEETKKAGVIGSLTPSVIKTAGTVVNKVAPVVSSILAEMIGKEPEHIIRAFKNPIEVAKKISQKTIPLQVREKAVTALGNFRKSYMNDFEVGLNEIKSFYGKFGESIQKTPFKIGNLDDITKNLQSTLRNNRISVVNKGKVLDFNKLNSSVIKSGEQKNIQQVWDTIVNQKDFSPQGVQDVAARINALSSFVEGSKNLSSKVITEIHNGYSKFIEETYPELGKLRQQYSTNTEIWKGIDEVLKSVKNETANPTATTNAVRKLSNVFAEDNDAYLKALEKLEKVSGTDILNDLAASEFKNLMPRRIGSVMLQAGLITGGFAYNPLIFLALPLFSPKLMGKTVTTAGKIAPKIEPILKTLPKILTPLMR